MAASFPPNLKGASKSILTRPVVSSSEPQRPPEATSQPSYLSRVQELKLMDEKGAVSFLGTDAVTLDGSEQETTRNRLQIVRKFQANGFEFFWNLLDFLLYLVPAFTSRFVNAKVALTSGGVHSLGETFWKKKVEHNIDPQLLALVTPDMWDFCKLEPRCYEVWVTLPAMLKDDPETVQRLMYFCAYCIAVQSLPHPPANHTKALAEFNHIYNKEVNNHTPSSTGDSDETAKSRVKDVEEALEKVRKQILVADLPFGKTIEVFCSPQMSMKITFAFQEFNPLFLMDGFHLELSALEDSIVTTPRFPPSLGLNMVHDHWVRRFSSREDLFDVNTAATALGRYWAYLTCFGEVLHGTFLENHFDKILIGCSKEFYDRATESGKQFLSQGEEPILAYYFNSQQSPVPSDILSSSPLGKLLIPFLLKRPESDALDAVLCMVGSLMGSLVPTFRSTAIVKPGIIIRWETPAPVYLRVGLSLDAAFKKILKDPAHSLPLMAQVLEIFTPHLKGASPLPNSAKRSGQLDEIFSLLKKEKPFSNELLNFYLFLNAAGNLSKEDLHVLELPSWVSHAVERGDLESTLEKLGTIYQSSPYSGVFCAVRNRVTGLSESQEQAASQAILLSGEHAIFTRAWNAYLKKFETDVDLLIKIASVLDVNAFPRVVKHVCEKKVEGDQERLRLLLTYFQRLTLPGFEALFNVYSQPLADLIKGLITKCPLDLAPYPQLQECLIDPTIRELGKLRGDLPTLNTRSDQWWTRFLSVQKSLKLEHQQEFDKLFKEAIGYPRAKLHEKKGFAEIFKRVADVEFLVRIAPGLDASAFPVILRHVCELKVAVDEERLNLLLKYFQRLTVKGFESLYKEHSQPLADLIRGLITESFDLSPYPKLQECLVDPTVRELGQLSENLPSLDTQSDQWWTRFLAVQKKVKSEHQLEFDQLFLKAMAHPKAMIHQKKGFGEIFSRIADDLLKQKNYASLIPLLGQIPLSKTDKIVIPRLQALLQSLMDNQVSNATWTAALNELRTSKTYEFLGRDFLVQVLRHLTERFSPEEICDQIRFLRDHVKPKREEVPKLPQHLLTFYAGLTNVNPLLDDLAISLPLFISWYEAGVTAQVLRAAKLLTPQDKNWGRFAALLDQMKKETLFLDGVLQVLEFLSNSPVSQSVARCFKTPISQKRLNPSQQRRLAEAYGLAMRQAPKGPAAEILQGVPSREWVMNQLKDKASWQSYLRFFFYLSTQGTTDHENLRWGIPFLLSSTEADLINEALQFLVRATPHNLNSVEWKFLVAGLVACNLSNDHAGMLLSLLSIHALPEEREFYEHCHGLRHVETRVSHQECQRLLTKYQETKTIPSYHLAPATPNGRSAGHVVTETKVGQQETKTIPSSPVVPARSNGGIGRVAPIEPNSDTRVQITNLLSKAKISAKDLTTVLGLLKDLPSTERMLWGAFFKAIPADMPADFLVSVWKAWLASHPLSEVQAGDEKYWIAAIEACLCRPISFEGQLAKEIDGFLADLALPLISTLSYPRELLMRCYEVGIEVCWRRAREKNIRLLQTLNTLSFDLAVKDKMGEMKTFFKPLHLLRITLLLVSESGEEFYPYWHGTFLKWAPKNNREPHGGSKNSVLFTHYCTRPYVPRGHEDQQVISEWVFKSWKELKQQLTWEQSCSLLSALCQFTEIPSQHMSRQLDSMWSELALGTQIQRAAVVGEARKKLRLSPTDQIAVVALDPPGPFIQMSLDVLRYRMKQTPERAERFAILAKMNQNFLAYAERVKTTQENWVIAEFQMLWCYHVFSTPLTELTSDEFSVVSKALMTLKSATSALQQKFWSSNAELALEAFVNKALPVIVGLRVPTDNWFAELSALIKGLALVPSIVDPAYRGKKFSFEALLMNLCEGVSRVCTQNTGKFVLKIFHDFIAPLPMLKKEQLALQKATKQASSELFFSSFLPLEDLKCLDGKDWEEAFAGLSISDFKPLKELAKQDAGLAVPRLIRWTRPSSSDSHEEKFRAHLSLLEQAQVYLELGLAYLERCNPAKGDIEELHILVEWVHAVCSFQDKCNADPVAKEKLNPSLSVLKTAVIKKFASHLFSCIQDEKSYFICSDLYLGIADRDPEALRAICAAFTIGKHLPVWIQNRLNMFKEILDSRVQESIPK